MSVSKTVKETWGRELFCVKSVPAFYDSGAAQVILTISGGPVLIEAIIEYNDTVMTNATTTEVFVGAIAMQTGTLSIQGAADTFVVSPLSCAAAVAKVAAALVAPLPSILAIAASRTGIVSAPATINVTFTAPAMEAANRYSLIVLYRKLLRDSLIS